MTSHEPNPFMAAQQAQQGFAPQDPAQFAQNPAATQGFAPQGAPAQAPQGAQFGQPQAQQYTPPAQQAPTAQFAPPQSIPAQGFAPQQAPQGYAQPETAAQPQGFAPPAQQGFAPAQQAPQGFQPPAQPQAPQGFQPPAAPAGAIAQPSGAAAGDPFASPAGAGEGHKIKDDMGSAVLVRPESFTANMKTSSGESDVIRCDWAVLDGPNAGQLRTNALIFNNGMVRDLNKVLNGKQSFLVGRVTEGVAKVGQSAPLIFNDAPEAIEAARSAAAQLGWV